MKDDKENEFPAKRKDSEWEQEVVENLRYEPPSDVIHSYFYDKPEGVLPPFENEKPIGNLRDKMIFNQGSKRNPPYTIIDASDLSDLSYVVKKMFPDTTLRPVVEADDKNKEEA